MVRRAALASNCSWRNIVLCRVLGSRNESVCYVLDRPCDYFRIGAKITRTTLMSFPYQRCSGFTNRVQISCIVAPSLTACLSSRACSTNGPITSTNAQRDSAVADCFLARLRFSAFLSATRFSGDCATPIIQDWVLLSLATYRNRGC